MCYNADMSDIERLKMLTSQMHLEPAEDACSEPLPPGGLEAITVKNAVLPNGKTISLLKTLLSSYCENNCRYCPFRTQRDVPRAAFTPDDFARLFNSLYQSGLVEGIFLSSSISNGPIRTQDLLLDTAAILRKKYNYQGYLHLKIMPGAEQAQVEEAMKLADRLSVNLEAPTRKSLAILAPQKELKRDLLNPLDWIHRIRTGSSPSVSWTGKWPSSTTQFVVGAAEETDLDILTATEHLHKSSGISRAYYSSFNPIEGTPLDHIPPSPRLREFRLYQASFLLRDYGFDKEDLIFQPTGNLELNKDPKTSWADHHLRHQPLEINTAPRHKLLQIPGLGPVRVARILAMRKLSRFRSFSEMKKLRLVADKSSPYLLINGRSPANQLHLF